MFFNNCILAHFLTFIKHLLCYTDNTVKNTKKLSERKISQFTGFYPNVGKSKLNFCDFPSSELKVLSLLKAFIGKTFMIHQKFVKTTKLLSLTVY